MGASTPQAVAPGTFPRPGLSTAGSQALHDLTSIGQKASKLQSEAQRAGAQAQLLQPSSVGPTSSSASAAGGAAGGNHSISSVEPLAGLSPQQQLAVYKSLVDELTSQLEEVQAQVGPKTSFFLCLAWGRMAWSWCAPNSCSWR